MLNNTTHQTFTSSQKKRKPCRIFYPISFTTYAKRNKNRRDSPVDLKIYLIRYYLILISNLIDHQTVYEEKQSQANHDISSFRRRRSCRNQWVLVPRRELSGLDDHHAAKIFG